GLSQTTQAISERSQHGRHTTSTAILHRLENGAEIIDMPGVRHFAPAGLKSAQLGDAFLDIKAHQDDCRFRNCQHIGEPSCAIKSAVDSGKISERRYQSYVSLHHQLGQLTK
ncbi:MAG: GTPase RsgA, partial [Gammaproteobacteria bacterium]|nr:GTPase RsgA [Gammaproteobacteria bacterium]